MCNAYLFKQLLPEYTIYNYGIKFNHVVQILLPSVSNCNFEGLKSTESLNILGVIHDRLSEISSEECFIPPEVLKEDDEREEPCRFCGDDPNTRCKICCCQVCGGKDAPEQQIVCDECNRLNHLWCLPEPLNSVPPEDEDWYCPSCKNEDLQSIQSKEQEFLKRRIATAKNSQKSSNSSSVVSYGKKWGRGMACVGRRDVYSNENSFKDHYGPIPGIEVGSCWRFRFQVSETGMHGPLVAGICGKESMGASSVVFASSYPDDIDLGDEIYFTGSGGREGEKQREKRCRVGGSQVQDQELRRCNKSLAISCFAGFNDVTGANAGLNWKRGKPIRLLRSGNGRKSSQRSPYLPKIGIRYDGIYRVVKYWPEKSSTCDFNIWRFLLRRDDPIPAPWTKEGKNRIRRLRLDSVIEPIGWLNPKQTKTSSNTKRRVVSETDGHMTKRSRGHMTKGLEKKISFPQTSLQIYGLTSDINVLIQKDTRNYETWQHLTKLDFSTRDVCFSRISFFQKDCFNCSTTLYFSTGILTADGRNIQMCLLFRFVASSPYYDWLCA